MLFRSQIRGREAIEPWGRERAGAMGEREGRSHGGERGPEPWGRERAGEEYQMTPRKGAFL